MSGKIRILLSYLLITLICLLLAICLIALVGGNLIRAFGGFFMGIAGSAYSIGEVFVKAAPLIMAGLGIAVAFRSGFTNIGAEGQLYMGAVAITVIAVSFPTLPRLVMLPLCIIFAALLGGIWALIPGLLKARFGLSEVINTIMFNYIALGIVGVLLQTVLKDPNNYFPVSQELPQAARLSRILPSTRLHTGIIIALILALFIYILLFKLPLGFRLRAVGFNPRACKCMGISVSGGILVSSLLSGGLAGIAGACEIAGLHHRLIEGISPSYGYLAIIVSLLGANHPWGVVLAAIGIAALQVGSQSMQRAANIPSAIASIIMGAVVLLILARKTLFARLLKEGEHK